MTRLINEQGDNALGYDDLGRLSFRGPNGGGSGPTLSWSYDRFGNRLSQTAGGSGSGSFPQPSFSVDPGSNRMTGFTYDQAGNVINDGLHTYTYDQEGNLIYVDGGQTAWDDYDALNRRVMHATGDLSVINNYKRYEYGLDGRVTDVWRGEDTYENLARYYGPKGDSFAYWTGGTNLSNEQVHYQHTDYLGTVKARTDPSHNVEAAYADLPFGERTITSGTDDNTEHFATLDRDSESDTHHAQFRTYEPRIGRWLQPDPYNGSYRRGNPQSFNRYSYVMNNPLGFVDRSGLYPCSFADGTEGDDGTMDGSGSDEFGNCLGEAVVVQDAPGGGGGGGLSYNAPDDDDDSFESGSLAAGLFGSQGYPYWAGASNLVDTATVGYGTLAGAAVAAPAVVSGAGGLFAKGIGYYLATAVGASRAVLGRFPEYLDYAQTMKANVFSMPPSLYSGLDRLGLSWTANQAFIDRVLSTGQQIYLANPPLGQEGSIYSEELFYLRAMGYGPESWQMVIR